MTALDLDQVGAEYPARERVGFIGLGNMGKPVARNLIAAGHAWPPVRRWPGPPLRGGVGVIDAAVSGAAERSERGALSLMVGGDPALVERARPLFEVVGSEVFHMGGLGMGQATKQCNNMMSLVNVHVVEEALRLAREVGIDEAQMRQVAEASTGDSWALRNIEQMRALAGLHGDAEVVMARFGRKDLSLASKLAAGWGLPVPIADFVFDLTREA